MRLTVSTPSSPGIMISISTKSGFSRLYSVIASLPFAASLASTFSNESINRLRWNLANAESSTIKHVMGVWGLDPRSVKLSIMFLRAFRLTRRDDQPVRNVRERANPLYISSFDGGARHPEYRTRFLVLCHCLSSCLLYFADPFRPIGSHAGHDDCRRIPAVFSGNRAN